MGCLYGRMLQFDNACRSFLEAYRLYPQVRIKEKYIYLHLIWDRREALLSHMEQLDISDALLRECEQSYRQTLDQADLAYDDRVTVADMKVQYRKENGYH